MAGHSAGAVPDGAAEHPEQSFANLRFRNANLRAKNVSVEARFFLGSFFPPGLEEFHLAI